MANPFVVPDVRAGAGYSLGTPSSGPNEGISYVQSANFSLATASWINDGFLATWATRTLPAGAQADECRTAMGLSPGASVSVNFNTFNGNCKGLDMVGFVRGVLDHEQDHHNMAAAAAMSAENDPVAAVESLFDIDEIALSSEIRNEVVRLDGAIKTAAGATKPSGNWNQAVWIWDSNENLYQVSATWSFVRMDR